MDGLRGLFVSRTREFAMRMLISADALGRCICGAETTPLDEDTNTHVMYHKGDCPILLANLPVLKEKE